VKAEAAALSFLVRVEFSSVLAQKVRMKEMTAESAGRILALFRLHLAEERFHKVSFTGKESDLADEWLGRFIAPLRTLDALHLAMAYSHKLVLLTADKKLAECAEIFGAKYKLLS
jgi:hypothetical protein